MHPSLFLVSLLAVGCGTSGPTDATDDDLVDQPLPATVPAYTGAPVVYWIRAVPGDTANTEVIFGRPDGGPDNRWFERMDLGTEHSLGVSCSGTGVYVHTPTRLRRLDPASGEVDWEVATPGAVIAVHETDSHVWVAREGAPSLLSIELQSGEWDGEYTSPRLQAGDTVRGFVPVRSGVAVLWASGTIELRRPDLAPSEVPAIEGPRAHGAVSRHAFRELAVTAVGAGESLRFITQPQDTEASGIVSVDFEAGTSALSLGVPIGPARGSDVGPGGEDLWMMLDDTASDVTALRIVGRRAEDRLKLTAPAGDVHTNGPMAVDATGAVWVEIAAAGGAGWYIARYDSETAGLMERWADPDQPELQVQLNSTYELGACKR